MLNAMDREARYMIIRDCIDGITANASASRKLSVEDTQQAHVEASALIDVAVSLVEAIHIIAEAQREQAMNYAS